MTDNWSWEKEKAGIQFEFRTNSVDLWEEKALSLKEASEKNYAYLVETHKIIEQDLANGRNTDKSIYLLYVGLASTWMLSVGFAAEALIKALIILTVSSSVQIIILDKKGNKKFNIKDTFGDRAHDLNYLLRNRIEPIFRPKLTDEEILLMHKMTSYTIWRGKYPIPLGAALLTYSGQGIEPDLIEKIIDRSVKYPEYVDVDKDKKAFDNVFKKIHDELSKAKKIKGLVISNER